MTEDFTPVGQLGLSPKEALAERRRRSRLGEARARERAAQEPVQPSLEDRVAELERLVASLIDPLGH